MKDALVICVGNRARGDDGVARRVAERLEGSLPEGVTLCSQPNLDVVLAPDVAVSSLVVFVDAERRTAPTVRTVPLRPDPSSSNAHALHPPGLLALASALCGRVPEAILVSVAAPEMGHGEGLSETAEAASIDAASEVMRLLGAGSG